MTYRLFLIILCLLLSAAFLSGCATRQLGTIDAETEVAQYPAPGSKPGVLGHFAISDDQELAYVSYTGSGARTALVYLHGIESHAGWFTLAAEHLRDQCCDVYLLDRRGSGLNRENRGFLSGHMDSYQTLWEDMGAFITPLRKRYDQIFLVGLSWGGKLALSYGLKHPEMIDGLVLITPGLRAKVDVSFLNKVKILLLTLLNPTARVATPIEPSMFTTTPEYLDYIRNDPLRLTSATVRFYWQSNRLEKYIDRNITHNRIPIQLFLAGKDEIINNDEVLTVLQYAEDTSLEVLTYKDQTHSIQLDASQRLIKDMRDWIRRHSN